MRDYPDSPVLVNHVEPVPRRIRAFLNGQAVLDTTSARYVWENPFFPQYYIPLADVLADALVDEGTTEETPRGDVKHYGVRVGDVARPVRPRFLRPPRSKGLTTPHASSGPLSTPGSKRTSRCSSTHAIPTPVWTRCAPSRHLRVEAKGVVLAESSSPVMCFETGSADSLLRRPDRRRLQSSGVVRHRDRLSLQGRDVRSTGRPGSGIVSTRTSPGPMTSPPGSLRPSPDWSPSITRSSICSSTASSSSGRTPTSRSGRISLSASVRGRAEAPGGSLFEVPAEDQPGCCPGGGDAGELRELRVELPVASPPRQAALGGGRSSWGGCSFWLRRRLWKPQSRRPFSWVVSPPEAQVSMWSTWQVSAGS